MRLRNRFVAMVGPVTPTGGWTVAIVQPRSDVNLQDPRRRATEPTKTDAFDLACVISRLTGLPIVDTSTREVRT